MEQDEDYRPVPAFGRQGEPAMEGDINKFCRHLLGETYTRPVKKILEQ